VSAHYDRRIDHLHVWFGGAPVPSMGVLVWEGNGEVWLRVDPATDQVVGIEIGHFLSEFATGLRRNRARWPWRRPPG
jgi:hypothetical protein